MLIEISIWNEEDGYAEHVGYFDDAEEACAVVEMLLSDKDEDPYDNSADDF